MSKKPTKKEDTISQLKKEENKIKKNKKKEEEESSEEEEEQNENDIKEQTIQKSDKPKNLKDLLSSMDSKPKAKKAKPQPKEKPKKMAFYNSKGTGNANSKISKENEKIKPTKNYTDKDVEKVYNEDVAKPQFFTSKESEDNFVELNKNEDVRNHLIYYIILFNVVIR